TPFDRLVEQHYVEIYQMAVDLVSDPLAAARVTNRALRHAEDLMSRQHNTIVTRRTLTKIVYLESAADSLRVATA
ncbi:MAG TPA: hypothetical protein VFO90_00310, partial [Terrimicrobiaceae bacterium]|nr:hypothetical protein [Terrimicrobiaceae bacterium]